MRLELNGKSVTIDTEAIAGGLLNFHNEDEGKKTMLAFGMLDALLMESSEEAIKKRVFSEFSQITRDLFEPRINKFLSSVNHEIVVKIYSGAKMVV
jgi:hypothetical protein